MPLPKGEKVFFFRVTVEGRGEFPTDMLRYDRCFPASERESYQLDRRGELRKVELTSVHSTHLWNPTEARWNSFGWRVVGWRRVE